MGLGMDTRMEMRLGLDTGLRVEMGIDGEWGYTGPGSGTGLATGHRRVAVGPGRSPAPFQPRCSSRMAQASPFPGCPAQPSPAVTLGALGAPPYTG